MTLDEAYDALDYQVGHFYNQMLRRRVKELPAGEWVDVFRAWLDRDKFERDHEETLRFLQQKKEAESAGGAA